MKLNNYFIIFNYIKTRMKNKNIKMIVSEISFDFKKIELFYIVNRISI